MRRIYLESRSYGWTLHSLYDTLIGHPPQGYKFVTVETQSDRGSWLRSFDKGLVRYSAIKHLFDYIKPNVYLGYYSLSNRVKKLKSDFTYASQHVVFRKEPWIVDMEFVNALAAYGKLTPVKNLIEKRFGSRFCKWILPWTEMARKSLFLSLTCKNFREKIHTVHLAVTPKHFKRKHIDDKVRLLFVGTKNIFNVPYSFELKGGYIILSAFERLLKNFSNIELIIRSQVPSHVKQKYNGLKNIQIIDRLVSKTELRNLFISADVFVFPGYQTPGLVILDAMSYELPVVATDVWANHEMVQDGITGLLINKQRDLRYHDENLIPLWGESSFLKKILKTDPVMVDELVDKLTVLIQNRKLRERIGKVGKREIDEGKFSIIERNKQLGKLFDEIR